MKKFYLLLINLSLCLLISLGFFSISVSATDINYITQQKSIDLDNVSNKNVQFYRHSAEEYKDIIKNDNNIPQIQKNRMIDEVNSLEKRKDSGGWDYWTIYDVCKVTSSYKCRPYFYAYARFAGGTGYPEEIQKVQYANIDRNDGGTSKQFSGTLYYHLEKSDKLHWDLNGDFYNNGTTSVGTNASIGLGQAASISFSASSSTSSNHYAYCHKYGDVTF